MRKNGKIFCYSFIVTLHHGEETVLQNHPRSHFNYQIYIESFMLFRTFGLGFPTIFLRTICLLQNFFSSGSFRSCEHFHTPSQRMCARGEKIHWQTNSAEKSCIGKPSLEIIHIWISNNRHNHKMAFFLHFVALI